MKIIHSHSLNCIITSNDYKSSKYCIIDLSENPLKNSENGNFFELISLSEDDERDLRKEYIDLISRLTVKYSSIEWWANDVSEKNEYVPELFRELCLYYRLVKTIDKCRDFTTIFVICNVKISRQLSCFCRDKDVFYESLANNFVQEIKNLKRVISDYLHMFAYIFKLVLKKFYVGILFMERVRALTALGEGLYCIRTWIDNRFDEKKLYNDTHFGRLPDYAVKKNGKVLIICSVSQSFFSIVRRIRASKSSDLFFIPHECFLTFSDIFKLLNFITFRKSIDTEKNEFKAIDVSVILDTHIGNGYRKAYFLFNISTYLTFRSFSKRFSPDIIVMTFENYAWEKMIVLGVSKESNKTKVFAFQHAYVSMSSFKYFLGDQERDIVPLPDKIVTMGQRTKDILIKYGHYKKDILTVGCALRQEYLTGNKLLRRRKTGRVLVPFTMVIKDTVSVIKFLYDSKVSNSAIKIVLRFHPLLSFDKIKKYIGFELPDNFITSDKVNVKEDLFNCDIVLYTWSTVALEGVISGLPAIYLNIMRPMNVDPLFECNHFKGKVSEPKNLLENIEYFYNLSDKSFYEQQLKAHEYLKEYFYPVNEANMLSYF